MSGLQKTFALAICLLAIQFPVLAAHAAPVGYPKAPITFIVCYSAGGGSDAGARILASAAEKYLGKVIVNNKPGAGGAIGWTTLVNAKPDGRTMALLNIPSMILLPLQGYGGYSLDQIVPVIQLVDDPALLMVRKGGKFGTYEELVSYARVNPGKVTMATCGAGSDIHIIAEMMNEQLGIRLNSVPFAGTADAVTSVIGGHSDVSIPKVSEVLGALESDQAVVLASFTEERLSGFEEVPTMKELGIDLVHSSSRGVGVPKGTPQEIVDFLHDTLKKATEDPEYIRKMHNAGLTTHYRNGKDFGEFYMKQHAMFKPVIEQLGMAKQ